MSKVVMQQALDALEDAHSNKEQWQDESKRELAIDQALAEGGAA